MRLLDALSDVFHPATVAQVVGAPVTEGGLTIIPVSKVVALGGGGGGVDELGHEGGGGGGWHVSRPLGAFVVRDGDLNWEGVRDPRELIYTLLIATFGALAAFGAYNWVTRRAAPSFGAGEELDQTPDTSDQPRTGLRS